MSKQSEFKTVALEVVKQILEDGDGRVSVQAVRDILFEQNSDVIDRLMESRQEQIVRNEIRSCLRKNLKQAVGGNKAPLLPMDLPGDKVPATIAVRLDGQEYVYVRIADARWEDLVNSDEGRVDNLAYAEKAHEDWQKKMNFLRRFMEGTNRTVAEALQLQQKEQEQQEQAHG